MMSNWRAACLMLLLSTSACAPHNPNLTPAQEHMSQADQITKDLIAVSQTAINLNAAGKLSDAGTLTVRDAVLVIEAAVNGYGTGAATAQSVAAAYDTAWAALAQDAKLSTPLQTTLAVVKAAIDALGR